MDINALKTKVKDKALDLGFELVRFAEPPLGEAGEKFEQWLGKNYHGEMTYLARNAEKTREPSLLLPQVRSLLVLGHSYETSLANTHSKTEGHVARYAWGEDYHSVLQEKLKSLKHWLRDQVPDLDAYLSVDASPLLEKAWAQKAGVGWMGKHTNIIHLQRGSYFFLAAMLTNLPFAPDAPIEDHCGKCETCIEVCPTRAIVAPYVLDARLCISYLTIELKGAIPRHLRSLIGNHVFGCDDCQEVCPWNRFSQPTSEGRFFPREGVRNQRLSELLEITPEEFKRHFAGSAILRAKWRGFIRNVLVAIGNSGELSLASLIVEKLSDAEPLIRGHAVWAYHSLLGKEAHEVLKKLRVEEQDPFVLEEIEATFC